MRRHLRRWGAAWLIAAWFTASLAAQVVAQRAAGDDPVDVIAAVAENWQSEALQLLAEAVFFLGPAAALLFGAGRGDSERLARIEEQLAELASRPALTPPPPGGTTTGGPLMAAPVHGHDLVDHLITYRQPAAGVGEVMSSLRGDFLALGHRIVDETPAGPDQTVAIRKLHEAAMATIANLALNPEDPT